MKPKDITLIRLHSQQIAATNLKSVQELVTWMGAMQAQDYPMAKWAVGTRLRGITEQDVDQAIHSGEVIRTHVLRPTWHLVKAEELPWMLELSAPQIKTSMRSRDKELGLTEAIFIKSNKLIEKSLRDDKHFTREEIMELLTKAKIATAPEQAWHLLVRAELDCIVCSGNIKDQKQTYTLAGERIRTPVKVAHEEALARLATLYFQSHCPATLKDFTWWSGLPAGSARKALELIKPTLIVEKISDEVYYLTENFKLPPAGKSSAYLLPAFDEYLISYKDRTAAIHPDHQVMAFTGNGIFRPVVVVNGEVTGIWKRTVKKDKVIVETDLFKPAGATATRILKKEAAAFATFLGKEIA